MVSSRSTRSRSSTGTRRSARSTKARPTCSCRPSPSRSWGDFAGGADASRGRVYPPPSTPLSKRSRLDGLEPLRQVGVRRPPVGLLIVAAAVQAGGHVERLLIRTAFGGHGGVVG